jgi:hypothetical protein
VHWDLTEACSSPSSPKDCSLIERPALLSLIYPRVSEFKRGLLFTLSLQVGRILISPTTIFFFLFISIPLSTVLIRYRRKKVK